MKVYIMGGERWFVDREKEAVNEDKFDWKLGNIFLTCKFEYFLNQHKWMPTLTPPFVLFFFKAETQMARC